MPRWLPRPRHYSGHVWGGQRPVRDAAHKNALAAACYPLQRLPPYARARGAAAPARSLSLSSATVDSSPRGSEASSILTRHAAAISLPQRYAWGGAYVLSRDVAEIVARLGRDRALRGGIHAEAPVTTASRVGCFLTRLPGGGAPCLTLGGR